MRHASWMAVLLALVLGCRTSAPRPTPPTPEAPKTEAPKPEAPKPEAPKPEAPQAEAPKPKPPPPAKPAPPPWRISAVRPYAPPAPAPSDAAVLQRFGFAPERVSFLLYDPRTHEAVAQQGADTLHAPASTAKVFTALAALEVLGPSHTFPTALLRRGPVAGGVLKGDLYLRGSGDPQLSYARLAALAQALRAAGITRITGRFLYDDAFLWVPPTIDPEQAEDASYSPALSALSVDSDRFSVRWRPTGAPGEVEGYTVPSFGRSPLDVYPGPDDGVGLHRAPAPEGWLLSQDLPPSGERRVPLRAPSAWAAVALRRFAAQAGVTLPEPAQGLVPAKGALPISTQRGPPLIDEAEATLLPSNNAMAELLLMSTARQLTGKAVPLPAAGEALAAWWRARVPQGNWEGFSLQNGSGLNAKSRATPRQLVQALEYARRHTRTYGRPFFTLLPVGGWSGTLAGRLTQPETAFNVWAKTGSMDYASGMVGHLFTPSGRELLFCILVSDLAQRDAQRARPVANLKEQEGREKAADAWMSQARALQDALLQRWALAY
ncbi:D-alanyl-D-alanine carboxypeptidase/D-alanyl-D-alanine-endopeptidase [Aggregicoccus sp. 17bor-14]|uniref:D-alanyl-D-alanine carboxypeptidase/D-alanyl-D-alanine endopeptidase n=1 Tax=Myxococcaceae TaxID=31 RepID=UPI00129C2F00|nr:MULTISPECIES: D-alanyl-D-alanine carboxypeptidase/D-alanyl-D-alanine-endopeptidase [Myxococcaceae]MBF5043261.1 D-alanyl-D-alanine carboxypeptidase/D-alanyl-D-alanine-endopeptidase [Simulacricoccus sp. 17bor-14]MRI89018.1 D-alanyl-D-alanine carboxypeptidase/D-alanyl-D-alanine-endopeptidase [Aggregicoccus sp. 17bor-14]